MISDQDPNGVNCVSLFEHALKEGGWRLRPSSIAVYRSMWRRFESVAAEKRVDVASPTSSELQDLVYDAYPDSENTANKLFRVILKVYEHSGTLGASGLVAAKEVEHRFFDKAPVVRTAFLPPQVQVEAPLAKWKKLRNGALHALVRIGAPRAGELRALVRRDVQVAPDKVTVTFGKGRSKRHIPVDLASAEGVALANFDAAHPDASPTAAFLCADEDGSPLNAATVYRQLKAFSESAGVEPERHGTGAFRATLAKKMLDEGKTIEEIRVALGHRLATSTEEFLRNIQNPVSG